MIAGNDLLQPPSDASKTTNRKEPIHILHVQDLEDRFDIENACCADEALEKLSTGQYDAVISDYEMPQKDGIQFLKELREQNNDIPFVLFTGRGREEVAIKALNLGADAYINKQGNPETVYGELSYALVNTVERKTFKRLHFEFESKYRNIVENTLLGIVIVQGPPARFVFANAAMGKLTGYSPEELVALSPEDIPKLIHPDDRMSFFNRFGQRLAGKKVESIYEVRGIRKDGSTTWLEASANLIEHNGQKSEQAAFLDITERKRAEQHLQESEEKYKTLFEQAGDYILILEVPPTGVPIIYDANTSALQIHGYTREEIIGKPITFLDENSGNEQVMDRVKKLLNNEKLIFESKHRRKDGSTINAEVSIKKVKVGSKNFLVSVERDITERKKAGEALRESEANYRNLINGMDESAWVIDFEGNFLDLNNAAVEMLGYSKEELLSLGIKGIDNYLSSEQVKDLTSHVVSGETQVFETVHTTKDGKNISVEISSSLVTYHGKSATLAIARNITERKKVEEQLKIAAGIFDLATDSIFVHDMEGNIVTFNEAAYKCRGYSKDEMTKIKIQDLNSPESAQLVKLRIDELLKNGGAVFEAVEVCKDKSLLPVDVHARLIDLEGKKLILSVARDARERKVAEKKLKDTNDRIEVMNEKLRVVGSLTRHDVRNKLSAVNGYTYLLKKKYAGQMDIAEGLGKIEQVVADSVKIFEAARMYEQLGVEELTFVDAGKAVDEAAALFSGLTIKVVNDCNGTSVLADSFLRQLFYNFIDNTRKYGAKATTIKVYFELEESGGLCLIYEDDGIGIPTENKSKLFKEGFSTGGSTGFGLFFIKKMMDVYDWTLTEKGEPGKGAKFIISIPANAVSNFDKK